MSLLAHALTHAHGFGVARRLRRALTPLPLPVVSVGNIAFGGRAKTPLVAALAAAARRDGRQPGVLSRGYGRQGSGQALVVGIGDPGPSWLRTLDVDGVQARASVWSAAVGDEPAWLAATLGSVPVGVGADRRSVGESLRARFGVDLLFLDDGFQHPLPRSVDVVLEEADDGTSRRLSREPRKALGRADIVVRLGPGGGIRRRPGPVHELRSGRPVASRGAVRLLVGLADPDSARRTAEAAGFDVRSITPLGDHRPPGFWRRTRLRSVPGAPWLVTEKDAIGWAAAAPPPGPTLVLSLDLDGTDALWEEVRRALEARGA